MKSGFSTIELIVSVALFALVAAFSSGAVVGVLRGGEAVRSDQIVAQNLNFIVEDIVRNVRSGSAYHCLRASGIAPTCSVDDPDCNDVDRARDCTTNFSTGFAFEAQTGDPDELNDQIVYQFQNGQLLRSQDGGSFYLPVTPPTVEVTDFQVRVNGSKPYPSDNEQPTVAIYLEAINKASRSADPEPFRLQAYITQRLLDYPLSG